MDQVKNDIEHHFLSSILSPYIGESTDRIPIVAKFGMLVILMYEDGEVHENEISSLAQYLQETINLSEQNSTKIVRECIKRLAYGFNMKESLNLFCCYIKEHAKREEKEALIQSLQKIAQSDNDYGAEEDRLIQQSKEKLGLNED